jgi:hypothetical protein
MQRDKKNERREKIHFGYSLSWHLKYMAYLYYPLEREISDFSLIHIKKKVCTTNGSSVGHKIPHCTT